MQHPTKQFPKVGDLVKVRKDPIGYDPIGYGGQIGLVIKDGRQTAKVLWLNAKSDQSPVSWVHYNRLRLLSQEQSCK